MKSNWKLRITPLKYLQNTKRNLRRRKRTFSEKKDVTYPTIGHCLCLILVSGKVKAKLTDGVLDIILPKAKPASVSKKKSIQVK